METELFTIAYFSRNALRGRGGITSELDHILRAARRNNAAAGITGALLYSDGCFAQVLEGSLSRLEVMFEKIGLDDRHHEVTLLHFKPLERRVFGQWSMAFAGLAGPAAFHLRATFENPDDIPSGQAGRALIAVLRDLIDKCQLHDA